MGLTLCYTIGIMGSSYSISADGRAELYKVIHEKRLDSDPHILVYYVYNEKTN
jgi:hypothetical protein